MTSSFDAFVGGIDRPMVVVTAAHGAERSGCLVGFSTQVSIDPPRFLVCISKKNHTYPVALAAATLTVHAVPADRLDLAQLFGGETGDEVDKLAHCRWSEGPDETVLLDDCPLRFRGRVHDRIDLGDHFGFVLDPLRDGGTEPDGFAAVVTFADVQDLKPGHPA